MGRTNPQILRRFLGDGPTEEEITRMSLEKEARYRCLCRRDPASLHLVEGARELFDFLLERGIPFTIATVAERTNVDFYFQEFGLSRWFSPGGIVYDDGTFPGKPDPEIFFRAAQKLGVPICRCLVAEDSLSGVEAARRAGAGRIVAVCADGDDAHLVATGALAGVEQDFCGFLRYLEDLEG